MQQHHRRYIFRNGFSNLIHFSLYLIVALLLFSCAKDHPIREETDPPPNGNSSSYSDGFFIINEGNFNWGNSSVTFISELDGSVQQEVFQQANNSRLGDVAQSMKILNDRGYIVVNNSSTVEVVDLKTFISIKSIEGFNSPRYIEFIDSNKAYVTNLYGDISVVDLNSLTITKTIKTPEWTEGMLKYQHYMLVTCIGSFNEPSSKRKAKLLIIDSREDRIIDSIQTGKEPLGIVIDKKLKLWVLCSGGWDGFEPPALFRINPDLREIEKAFTFTGATETPSRLSINPTGDTLYFLKNGIYQMSVSDTGIPASPFIPASGKLFYGLAIHPVDGTIFATDAIDYVQNGVAFQFSSSVGTQLDTWTTGRIPGSFCFGDIQHSKNLD